MRISLKRVGAIYHWRIGRIGGSFYISKAKPKPQVIELKLSQYDIMDMRGNISRFDQRPARIKGN